MACIIINNSVAECQSVGFYFMLFILPKTVLCIFTLFVLGEELLRKVSKVNRPTVASQRENFNKLAWNIQTFHKILSSSMSRKLTNIGRRKNTFFLTICSPWFSKANGRNTWYLYEPLKYFQCNEIINTQAKVNCKMTLNCSFLKGRTNKVIAS